MQTPAEASAYQATPSLADTVAFVRDLAARSRLLRLESFGRSPVGREMPLVIAAAGGDFTPEAAARRGKAVVLVQNGIHAGEIDGKDAALAILRDLASGRHVELLDSLVLLFVPVYNVDGHERVSPYNRPNQDGPRAGMGFRTTAAGLDLNRDYLKAQSVEARHLLALFNHWRPHLHVDVHVTDGVDHDWVLTWAAAEAPQLAAPLDAWQRRAMTVALAASDRAGVRCGPYVDLVDGSDPTKGFSSFVGGARYSTGYFPLRNRPSVLIEMHSYKPYEQRVKGVTAFLLALLAETGRTARDLIAATRTAESAVVALGRPGAPASPAVIEYGEDERSEPIRFPVYAWKPLPSLVTGQPLLVFERGNVHEIEVPWFHRPAVRRSVSRPRGYVVLPGWPQINDRLLVHGLRVRPLDRPAAIEVETIRADNPKYAGRPYQGLTGVTADIVRRVELRELPAGSLWVPADQPDFEVAVHLLEPDGGESLFAWGLLSTVLEGKEYIDSRTLERIAGEMLADAEARAAWEKALTDEAFAADRMARYRWWYRRTQYWAVQEVGMLPCVRVLDAESLTRSQRW